MSATQLSVLAVLVTLLSLSSGQVFSGGSCPNVQTQSTFDLPKYLGIWYEVYKFYAAFESGQACAQANYTLMADGHIGIVNSGFKDGQPIMASGDAYVPDPVGAPAKLKLRFSTFQPYGNYWILSTDYDNYTLIYSCSNVFNLTHYEFAWILTRKKSIDDATLQKLYGIMKGFGINTDNFKQQNQNGCPDA